uniref:TF-B3 domain-containing protein n=1 Tax=Aegilops tauschii subsp. strangulata TaxID=200361 RepID=A0A453F415_AEGTS
MTNTGYAWRVTVWMINNKHMFDKGWAPFTTVHRIKIRYLVTIKLATPNTLKMIVFNNDDVEVVTKCKKHKEAFAMDA